MRPLTRPVRRPRSPRRDVPGHHRAGADDGIRPDRQPLQHGGPAADQHAVAERDVPEMFAPGFTHAAACPGRCRARCPSGDSAGVPAPSRTSVVTTHPDETTTPSASSVPAADLGPRVDQGQQLESRPSAEPVEHRVPRRREAEPERHGAGPARPARPRSASATSPTERPARARRGRGPPPGSGHGSPGPGRPRPSTQIGSGRAGAGCSSARRQVDERLALPGRRATARRTTSTIRGAALPSPYTLMAAAARVRKAGVQGGPDRGLDRRARSSAASMTLAPLTRPRCRSPTLTTGTPKLAASMIPLELLPTTTSAAASTGR